MYNWGIAIAYVFLMFFALHQSAMEIATTVIFIIGTLFYLQWRNKKKKIELLKGNLTSFMPINLVLFYAVSVFLYLEFAGKGWWSFFAIICIANTILISFDLLMQIIKSTLTGKIVGTFCILLYWYTFWYFVASLARTFKPEKATFINTVITLILLFEAANMVAKIWRGSKYVQHDR